LEPSKRFALLLGARGKPGRLTYPSGKAGDDDRERDAAV